MSRAMFCPHIAGLEELANALSMNDTLLKTLVNELSPYLAMPGIEPMTLAIRNSAFSLLATIMGKSSSRELSWYHKSHYRAKLQALTERPPGCVIDTESIGKLLGGKTC